MSNNINIPKEKYNICFFLNEKREGKKNMNLLIIINKKNQNRMDDGVHDTPQIIKQS